MSFTKTLAALIFLLFGTAVMAQEIRLKGVVIDKNTREELPYCNIYIPQLKQGLSADEEGRFDILLSEKADSIIFYYLGYKNEVLKWRLIKREIDWLQIEMESTATELEEIVIKAPKKRYKDTVAIRIYRGVVANKENNRPKAFDSYEYDEYSRIVGSYYNFNPKLVNRRFVRPFRFVIENYDTTADGRRYVPLLIKEKVTHHYFQKSPQKQREVITASKVSGIEQMRFSEVMDAVFDNMDVYGSQLILSGRGFVLPFTETALLRYKFFFIDSTENDACEWIYHLAFVPITKGDNAFRGDVWIHGPTFGIQRIEMDIDPRANLNWYNDFGLQQEFTHFPGSGWLMTHERRTTGISITQNKKARTLHLEQILNKQNIRVNEPIADTIWQKKDLYAKGHDKKDHAFWTNSRPSPLPYAQERVYYLLDTLKTTRAYKTYLQLGRTLSSGYYRTGPIDIGNIYNMVSWNVIEEWRLRFMTRSNRKLSQNFSYILYGAYGLGDKRFKYGITLDYRLPNVNNFLHQFGAVYKDDYERFSLINQEFDYDYFLNTLLRRRAFDDLVYLRNLNLYYRRQWTKSFTTEFSWNYRQYKTVPGQIEFTTTDKEGVTTLVEGFRLIAPRIYISYTPGARFLRSGSVDGKPTYLSGKLPRMFFDLSMSSRTFGSNFNYQKIGVDVEQRLPGPIGWTRYLLSASALFGEIPYPLLYIHQGNENFVFDYRRFSNMREGEYAADKQVSLLFEHHFDGLFLNKVPLIKKLKWREVFIAKMAYSQLNPDKTSFLDLPPRLTGLDGFYAELGFGLENVFRFCKGQFTWRLTQRDKPDVTKFAFRVAFNPEF